MQKGSGVLAALQVILPRLRKDHDAAIPFDDVAKDIHVQPNTVRNMLKTHFAGVFIFRDKSIHLDPEWGTVGDLEESAHSLEKEQVNPRSGIEKRG